MTFWGARAEYSTVPELGIKLVSVPDIAPVAAVRLRSLVPPLRVPAVRTTAVNEWVKPEPRFRVPPAPLIVRVVPPVKFPVNVAVPPVFVIDTGPEVLNAPILWSDVPVRINPPATPELCIVAPLLIRFPLKVNE